MRCVLLIVAALLSSSCFTQQAETATVQTTSPVNEPYIYERLHYYFSRNEIRPSQIINNLNYDGWKPGTETIRIGANTVKWTKKVDKNALTASVSINGNLIDLDSKKSFNNADGENKIDLAMVGNWDQIKLYRVHDQEVIAISVTPVSCTGLMCSVAAQLFYDLRTKEASFFGSYRTDLGATLFQLTGGNENYFVATNFSGDPHGGSISAVNYELYKLLPNGKFQVQKNAKGQNFYIKHTRQPEKLNGAKDDLLEMTWVSPIDLD